MFIIYSTPMLNINNLFLLIISEIHALYDDIFVIEFLASIIYSRLTFIYIDS